MALVAGSAVASPNWSAIEAMGTWAAAIATLGAVLLALYPLLTERRRARKVATNLRAQLATEMVALRPSLKRLASRPSDWGPAAVIRLDEVGGSTTAISRVLSLLPHAEILSPAEHDALVLLSVNLRMLLEVRGADAETAKHLLTLHDAAFQEIVERHTVLRGDMPTLPWDETEIESYASDPDVYAIRFPDRLVVVNRGTAPAYTINLSFPDARSPVVGADSVTIAELGPGQQREIAAAFSKDYYPPFQAQIQWGGAKDGSGSFSRQLEIVLRR